MFFTNASCERRKRGLRCQMLVIPCQMKYWCVAYLYARRYACKGAGVKASHNQMPVTQYLTKNEIGRFRLIVTFLLRTEFIKVIQPAAEQKLTAPIFISEAIEVMGNELQCESESPQTLMTASTRSNLR